MAELSPESRARLDEVKQICKQLQQAARVSVGKKSPRMDAAWQRLEERMQDLEDAISEHDGILEVRSGA